MYTFASSLALSAILILSIQTAFAQEDARELMPDNISEERASEPTTVRPQTRGALGVEAQNRIRNLTANVTNRFSAALSRMDAISARLESRIGKMSIAGRETADASEKLAEVQAAIARARVALSEIGSIDAAVSGDSPRDAYQVIRRQFADIRLELGNIQVLLRETLTILVQSHNETEVTEEGRPEEGSL